MKTKILVVDDDKSIVNMLKRSLMYEGYEVITAYDGSDAVQMVERGKPDLVILDIMLPQKNGWEVCRELRSQTEHLPIVMLTAKDEVDQRVKGLDLGADDYVVKPFALDELLARVRAQLRRYQQKAEEKKVLHFEDITLNLESRKAWRGGRELALKGKEFSLLSAFMNHPRHVMSKEKLLQQVWGMDYQGESNVIEVYIASLRQKMEKNGEKRLIQTIRGMGYVLRSE